MELCQMIIDSCAQQSTYEHFCGLLGQRLFSLRKKYVIYFREAFKNQYKIVHHAS
jgi:hypothetical protein